MTGSASKDQAQARRRRREQRTDASALWQGKDITGGWIGKGASLLTKGIPVHISELSSEELMTMLNIAKQKNDTEVRLPIKRGEYDSIIRGRTRFFRNVPRHKFGVQFFMAVDELLRRGEILDSSITGVSSSGGSSGGSAVPSGGSASVGVSNTQRLTTAGILAVIGIAASTLL